jgi:adenylate cyclase
VLRVKGKQKPMAVYELLAEGDADEPLRSRVSRYEKALSLYRGQQWDQAEKVLNELRVDSPDDLPAQALVARVHQLRTYPPPGDWDGVYVAKDK